MVELRVLIVDALAPSEPLIEAASLEPLIETASLEPLTVAALNVLITPALTPSEPLIVVSICTELDSAHHETLLRSFA